MGEQAFVTPSYFVARLVLISHISAHYGYEFKESKHQLFPGGQGACTDIDHLYRRDFWNDVQR